MSWSEVKKINSNLKKSLDTLISERFSSVETKIATEAKTPKTVACDVVYTSASQKTTVTVLEVTNFRGGKFDFEASLYKGDLASPYYPVLSIYVNGTLLTDTDLPIRFGTYSRAIGSDYIQSAGKELWLPSNCSIKVTIQTKSTSGVSHVFKYRLIGF